MAEDKKKGGTVIKPCNCDHEYQDIHYGIGQRVHNRGQGKIANVIRCTVCGTKKTL